MFIPSWQYKDVFMCFYDTGINSFDMDYNYTKFSIRGTLPIEARPYFMFNVIRSSNRSTPYLGIRDSWYERKNLKKLLQNKQKNNAIQLYTVNWELGGPWSCLHLAKWTILKLTSLFNKTRKFHAKCDQYKHTPILHLSTRASIGEFRV